MSTPFADAVDLGWLRFLELFGRSFSAPSVLLLYRYWTATTVRIFPMPRVEVGQTFSKRNHRGCGRRAITAVEKYLEDPLAEEFLRGINKQGDTLEVCAAGDNWRSR